MLKGSSLSTYKSIAMTTNRFHQYLLFHNKNKKQHQDSNKKKAYRQTDNMVFNH